MSQSTTPSRFRVNSKAKDSPKLESGNGITTKARPKSVNSLSPDLSSTCKPRRSLLLSKPKSGDEAVKSQKGRELEDSRIVGRPKNGSLAEQYARPRQPSSRRNEDGSADEKKNIELQETMIKHLQSEVLALKTELDKAQSFNAELVSLNKKLTGDLAAAQAKISELGSRHRMKRDSIEDHQSPNFKDIQKLIANKLEHSIVKKEPINETANVKIPSPPPPSPPPPPPNSVAKLADAYKRGSAYPSQPPPPPPPPLPRLPGRAASAPKATSVVEFCQSLRKQEGRRNFLRAEIHHNPTVSAHSSIVDEIQNRSTHLLAIKTDVETKGEFINGLIQKVLSAAYTDIEDVLNFVQVLDGQLSTLADERAVLKHFKWPERKADAMREAAVEYRELKMLKSEISSYMDDPDIPCGAALKKMARLLDKSEQGIQRLIQLRNSVLSTYQECKIPIDWMLDSGIMSEIKQGSMKLARMYMKRVMKELEYVRNSDREAATQEALLLQGVNFAYRAHQFAGGLDSETLCAFEEIRRRVPGHLAPSQQLLASS